MEVTTLARTEPWRGLPVQVADVIEPALPAATEEIVASIAREVPEYARPLEGAFGRAVETGVTEALRQFVALIRDPDAGRGQGREVYVGLGRGELREGRTLDALQAAYRVGARVAWRRAAAAAAQAGLGSDVLALLAEAIFAYIDELAADSVDGYAQAQSELEGERQRRLHELVALLLADPPARETDVKAAAAQVGWTLDRTVAPLACAESDLGRVTRRLSPEVLAAPAQGDGCVLIPDAEGPGRRQEIARAVGDRTAGLGPVGDTGALPASWELARAARRAGDAGRGGGLVVADEHIPELLLTENHRLVERIATRRLGALEPLTAKARARLEKTALAFVQERGNAAAMARALHVHPQTARHRLARLRELLGEQLEDPDARFELELALRGRGVAIP